jgi:signal transduction histidine kinase
LAIEKDQLDNISSKLMSGTIEIAEHFGVDIGSVEELLIKANQEIWKAYLTIEHLFKVRQELSQQILAQERERGALEAKNAAMATLFHYVNNSAMAIYGRSQMMRVNSRTGKKERLLEKLEDDLNVIDKSIQRIVAVLEEVREITPINQEKLSNTTEAINLDEKIEDRMNKMSTDQKWFTEASKEKVPVA